MLTATKMSVRETEMVARYMDAWDKSRAKYGVTSKRDTVEVSRKSDREFDLTVEFKDAMGGGVQAWLMLGCISELTRWYYNPIAAMTDYPDMARTGDWSAVRDTDNDKLWTIFERFCLVTPHIRDR